MSPATIPSSVNQRLSVLATRICSAGPDVLLQMMQMQLTSSNAMTVFERFGALTLPAPGASGPALVISISSRFRRHD